MKLIFSMPGVPSATPAQEKSAWIGPPHSSTAASMLALSRRSRWIALTPGQRDLGVVHDHDLGAEVLHELGGGGAHPGGAADHQGPLAVVAECVCAHVTPPSPRGRPGH